MDGWRTVNGIAWLCAERSAERDLPAELGLVLPYGYGHESPAEIGLTAAAVTALVRRVARPIETHDHRVVEPVLAARVGLFETVISVRGEPEAVRLGALALEDALRSPGDLELPDPSEPRRFAWSGWDVELAVWLGVSATTLAAENEEAWTGDQTRLAAFAGGLQPQHSRGSVVWTTEPELVGALFVDPPTRPLVDRTSSGVPALTWREPRPTTEAGSVTGSYRNNLLTARVPPGPVDWLALQLLVRTADRNLTTMTRLVASLEVTVERIGTDLLCAVRAVPKEGTTDWVAVRTALVQSLDACSDLDDSVLRDELEHARHHASTEADLVTQAIETQRTGEQHDPTRVAGVLAEASVDDLRRSIRGVLADTLVCLPSDEEAPPGRPLYRPADLPPVTRPTLRRTTRVPLRLRGIQDRQRLRVDATTLQQTLVPKVARRKAGGLGPATSAVDLTAVVARIDRGPEYSTLVDRDNRRIMLVWPAYRRVAPLRAAVDAATPPGGRVDGPAEPAAAGRLRSALRRQRIGEVLTVALLVVAAILIIWQPVTGKSYQEPVVSTVPVGTVITLGNGTTVQVSNPRWQDSDLSRNPVLVVDVRYCGGGETVDRNTGSDARNYLSPQRFSLTGITPASRQIYTHGSAGQALKETQLEQGQCTQGQLDFDIDAAKPPGIVVAYANGSGDRLQWTL